jgi:hypothetical protein
LRHQIVLYKVHQVRVKCRRARCMGGSCDARRCGHQTEIAELSSSQGVAVSDAVLRHHCCLLLTRVASCGAAVAVHTPRLPQQMHKSPPPLHAPPCTFLTMSHHCCCCCCCIIMCPQACYGIEAVPEGEWLCWPCVDYEANLRKQGHTMATIRPPRCV